MIKLCKSGVGNVEGSPSYKLSSLVKVFCNEDAQLGGNSFLTNILLNSIPSQFLFMLMGICPPFQRDPLQEDSKCTQPSSCVIWDYIISGNPTEEMRAPCRQGWNAVVSLSSSYSSSDLGSKMSFLNHISFLCPQIMKPITSHITHEIEMRRLVHPSSNIIRLLRIEEYNKKFETNPKGIRTSLLIWDWECDSCPSSNN